MAFLAILVAGAAIAQGIQAVGSILSALNASRSCILEVDNNTNQTLQKTSDSDHEHSHGGYAAPATPAFEIPPKTANLFGSANKGGAIMTGTEGSITYAAEGVTFIVYWDNPFSGDDTCDAHISGPLVGRYDVFHICGHGNQLAPMRYEIRENESPFSLRVLLQRFYSNFDPSRGLRSLQPGNTTISIRQLISI